MKREIHRSKAAGAGEREDSGAMRRPYEAPIIKTFGRRLPAFAPPSEPGAPGGRPPFAPD